MNGISVMPCVISEYTYRQNGSGMESRRQKCIRLSAGVREGVSSGSHSDNSAHGPSAVRSGSSRGKACRRSSLRTDPSRRQSVQTAAAEPAPARGGCTSSSLMIRGLILAVIFTGMLAGFRMMIRASSRQKEQTYKYYDTVTIGYGEDLTDIVYRYCDSREYRSGDDYLREICEINSIPYSKGRVPELHAGTKIVIPYIDTELK